MKADIGIIGGSGFYSFLENGFEGAEEVWVNTPHGAPSDKILLLQYKGKKIAFLPRHGKSHQYPPHKINYKANLFALRKLGVRQVIAPCAVGSLSPEIEPGDFVFCDQFINQTFKRDDTFYNGPKVAHISMAEPYCQRLREIAIEGAQNLGLPFHQKGTVVVIEGPRFSTKAESLFYSQFGNVINMTQYPEVALARELEMCYLNISLVTDYDVGLAENPLIKPVSTQAVMAIFQQNMEKLKGLILAIVENLSVDCSCPCQSTLRDSGI